MKEYVTYEPHFRQQRFHAIKPASGYPKLIKLYAGGLGSGKSTACMQEQAEMCLRTPRGESIALRKSMDRSGISLVQQFREMLAGHAVWHASDPKHFLFDNGHRLFVTPADRFDRFGSTELVTFYIQEAQEVKYEIFDALSQRLRHPSGLMDGVSFWRGYLCARGTTDSHWLYRDYISKGWNAELPDSVRSKTPIPFYTYVKGRSYDNQGNLPPAYINQLKASHPDRRWQRVYIDGEIGYEVEGRPVYEEYDPERHEADIDADPDVPILRGVDWGYRNSAVVWCQLTREGRLVVLRELTAQRTSTRELILEVESLEKTEFPGRHPSSFRDFADDAGDQMTSAAGITDIEIWENYFSSGVEKMAALVEDGCNVIRDLMMKEKRNGEGKRLPMFLVDKRCERLRAALAGGYCYDKVDESDNPKPKANGYEHIADALRYVAQIVAPESQMDKSSPFHEEGSYAFANY